MYDVYDLSNTKEYMISPNTKGIHYVEPTQPTTLPRDA